MPIRAIAIGLAIFATLSLTSCGMIGDSPTTTTGTGSNVTSQGERAPGSTFPESGPADPETPWVLLVVVGLGLVGLIVAFTTKGTNNPVTGVARELNWKDHARSGYAEARWVYDAMSEDVGVWRGNAQFDELTDIGVSEGTSRAQTWKDLAYRLDSARTRLYAFEAAAPDQRMSRAAREVVAAMLAVRSALDARAESRFAYRSAESQAGVSSGDLIDARDKEVRSSTNFNIARSELARTLTNLSKFN